MACIRIEDLSPDGEMPGEKLRSLLGAGIAANVVQRQARDINAATALGESFISQSRGSSIDYSDTDTLIRFSGGNDDWGDPILYLWGR